MHSHPHIVREFCSNIADVRTLPYRYPFRDHLSAVFTSRRKGALDSVKAPLDALSLMLLKAVRTRERRLIARFSYSCFSGGFVRDWRGATSLRSCAEDRRSEHLPARRGLLHELPAGMSTLHRAVGNLASRRVRQNRVPCLPVGSSKRDEPCNFRPGEGSKKQVTENSKSRRDGVEISS